MTTVMSAIGEATGVKPDDRTIAHSALYAARMKAAVYSGALIAASSPELKQMLNRHMQEAMTEYDRTVELLTKKGWYSPHEPPESQVRQAVEFAKG